MDNFLNLLKYPLDDHQIIALRTTKNAVIAAGAGSGKTQVLATRFAWLVMTEQAKASEILTLTFTNKAAAEMYQRIYDTLTKFANEKESENITEKQIQLAKNALEDFSNVHIQTLDSYCSSIVRQCANRYGIKPDFSVGTSDCERQIKDEAFIFILQNTERPSIKYFVKAGELQDFAESIFAKIILKFTSLSTKKGFFEKQFYIQTQEIVRAWNELISGKASGSIFSYIDIINDEYKACERKLTKAQIAYIEKIIKLIEKGENISQLKKITFEDVVNKSEYLNECLSQIEEFFSFVFEVQGTTGSIRDISTKVTPLKDHLSFYKSIVSFISQFSVLKDFYLLLDEFLQKTNLSKRISGTLSFADVSELSLKILLENEDIRNQEKNAYKKIMIDEFQDNNSKNRDLLYLISLKKGELENNGNYVINVPENSSLHDILKDKRSPDKLFFVGDEKQSIYKFRGADVSVFNELTKNNENELIPMTYNYRSDKELVKAFNVIFKNGNGLFDKYTEPQQKIDYEAYYDKDAAKKDIILPELTEQNIRIHTVTLYKKEIEDKNSNFIPANEQLCYNMAKTIYELGKESKNWGAFAILDRSRTDRKIITKYLTLFGIPFTLDQQKDIFTDGIINDFYNFLRICVYPSDINAYAAYLCSPFCGLNESSVEKILSYLNAEKSNDYDYVFNPFIDFSQQLKNDLSEKQYEKYISAQTFYKETKQLVLKQKITTTLSMLWNKKGYKYETYLNNQANLCEEHFDMLFELARNAEENGKNVSWFIDQLDLLKATYSKEDADIDASEITYPVERNEAVQIMTIHKSKGLQFDYVFLYGLTDLSSKSDGNIYFYDEKYGISIKPELEMNYFEQIQKENAAYKELAELRRLIYVGITRAVKEVFIMCKYEVPKKESKSILRLFENMIMIHYPYNPEGKYIFDPTAGFDYIPIKPISYSDIYHNVSKGKTLDDIRNEKIANFEEIYEKSPKIEYESNPIPRQTPSSLEKNYNSSTSEDSDSGEKYEKASDVLYTSNFTPADFGTLVHSYLENQANGIKPENYSVDPKLLKNLSDKEIEKNKQICIEMCHKFSASEKGIELENCKKNNLFYRAEWGFRMFYNGTIFTGSIDLIYQNADGTYTIVDYKSDNQVNKEKYIEQQKCYRTAAAKILKIPEENISLYLYFLKNNETVKI